MTCKSYLPEPLSHDLKRSFWAGASKEPGGQASVADGEAEVAQGGFVGIEAEDLGGSGHALKGQARPEHAGAGRVAAQACVKKGEAGPGGEQGIGLPCLSARPRPGRNGRRWRNGRGFRGSRRRAACARVPPCRRGNGLAEVGNRVGTEGEIGANHLAMMSLARRFVTMFGAESVPLVVGWVCPISLHYRLRKCPRTARDGPGAIPPERL